MMGKHARKWLLLGVVSFTPLWASCSPAIVVEDDGPRGERAQSANAGSCFSDAEVQEEGLDPEELHNRIINRCPSSEPGAKAVSQIEKDDSYLEEHLIDGQLPRVQ